MSVIFTPLDITKPKKPSDIYPLRERQQVNYLKFSGKYSKNDSDNARGIYDSADITTRANYSIRETAGQLHSINYRKAA